CHRGWRGFDAFRDWRPGDREEMERSPSGISGISGATDRPPQRLFPDFTDHAAGIARREHAFRNVSRHDTAGADHRAIADLDARQDDRPAADPDIRADLDRLAE